MSERLLRRATAVVAIAAVALAAGGASYFLRSIESDLDVRVTERAG